MADATAKTAEATTKLTRATAHAEGLDAGIKAAGKSYGALNHTAETATTGYLNTLKGVHNEASNAAERAAKRVVEGFKPAAAEATADELKVLQSSVQKAAENAYKQVASKRLGDLGHVGAATRGATGSIGGAWNRMFGKSTEGLAEAPGFLSKTAASIPNLFRKTMNSKAGPFVLVGAGLTAIAGGAALWRGKQADQAQDQMAATQEALQQQMMQAYQPVSYKNSVNPYESALLDERMRAGGNGGAMGDKIMADRAAAQATPVGQV